MLKKECNSLRTGVSWVRRWLRLPEKGYPTYLINRSAQDNSTLSSDKNLLILDRYDGLAGQRNLHMKR